MKTAELRRTFLDFYKSKGHIFVPGASTIPTGDQTILFTIAGMTQFKDILAGIVPAKHRRVTNSQKCIRAADLEDVGLDGRHLTMFEMLGLWSFGDYSKKESIAWSWEFITTVLKLDSSKVWASVHNSDTEAEEIWKQMGMPAERIVRLGDKDNFWAMGPTGPCGPCSEIYYDQGPSVGCAAGQGPTPYAPCKGPGCDCDRYLEFWNNVFMEFNRDESGQLHPLPAKNVDTGVGLERLAAICQEKTSAYDTDIFIHLARAVCQKIGLSGKHELAELSTADRQSVQVICDHLRTLVVTLNDGASFSNEGRGYVLRRILRRAVRYANRLQENNNIKTHEPVLYTIASDVAESLGDFYPELLADADRIAELIRDEESRFLKTLGIGLQHFRDRSSKVTNSTLGTLFSGEEIFVLHDSYGFPADLTALLCREQGLVPDLAGFEKLMDQQKERSRKHSRFYDGDTSEFISLGSPYEQNAPSQTQYPSSFTGYVLEDRLASKQHTVPSDPVHSNASAQLQALLPELLEAPDKYFLEQKAAPNALCYRVTKGKQSAKSGDAPGFEVIFHESPFYPEGGGQVSDVGYVIFGNKFVFEVAGVVKSAQGIVHTLQWKNKETLSGLGLPDLTKPAALFASDHMFVLNKQFRLDTARNHSATHLLHAALRKVLGNHVRQAGSQVNAQGLRFDFTHSKQLTLDERTAVEDLVRKAIEADFRVETHVDLPIEQAKSMGALAMFDEKYDDKVRVLQIADFSLELCGGTHVSKTSLLSDFRILSESSVTTGVRRIEAATGRELHTLAAHERRLLEESCQILKCAPSDLPARIHALREAEKVQQRRIQELEHKIAKQASEGLKNETEEIAADLRLTCSHLTEISSLTEFEKFGDMLKETTSGVVVVGGTIDGKAHLLALVHPKVRQKYPHVSAGEVIKLLAPEIEGRGGGKPEFARAGGSNTTGIGKALAKVKQIIQEAIEKN